MYFQIINRKKYTA